MAAGCRAPWWDWEFIHAKAAESEKEEREARKLNGINQARDLRAAFDLSQRQADIANLDLS
ncbi:hypothetical protein [Streptomyces sp. NPDC048340]|uniref:hypothetical protein n=1 Tax=Streptomyces sp. NPDC048340 TaxID=3365537 RepID=UPI00371EBBD4